MPERDWAEVVRGLRAKADSTTYPAEAQALRARADELAAKYGVVEGDDLDVQLEALQAEWDAWEARQLQLIEQERSRFEAHMAGQRAMADQIRAARRAGPQTWWGSTSATSGSWVVTVNF